MLANADVFIIVPSDESAHHLCSLIFFQVTSPIRPITHHWYKYYKPPELESLRRPRETRGKSVRKRRSTLTLKSNHTHTGKVDTGDLN